MKTKKQKQPTAYVLKSWDGKYFEQMTGIDECDKTTKARAT